MQDDSPKPQNRYRSPDSGSDTLPKPVSGRLPPPIDLRFRPGMKQLSTCLESLEAIGINRMAPNLRFNQAETKATLRRPAGDLLPNFRGLGNMTA